MAVKTKPVCKLCGTPTNVGFNINFKRVPICEDCGNTIFIQQAKFFANLDVSKLKPKK